MSVGIDGGDRGPHRSGDTGRADGMRTEGAGRGRRAKRSAPNREDGPPDPARRRERTPQERGRLDLRLVVPALAAWLTAAVCLGVSPGAAGTAGVAVVVVAVGFGALAALRGRTERGCGRGGRAVPGRAVRGRTRGRCAVRGWVGLGVLSLGAAGLVLVSLGGQGALARTAPLVAAADRGETVRVELSVDQVPRRLGPSRFGGGERIAVEGTAREVAVAPQRPQTSPGVEGRTAGPRAARTGDITDDRGVADSDGPSHGGVGGQDAGRIGTGGEAVAANARRYIRLGGRPARMLAFVTLDTSTVTCAEADTCRAGDAGADDGVGPGDAVDLGDILILRGHAVPSEAADRERVVLPGASIESVRAPTGWRGMVSRLRRGLMGAAAAVPGDAGALIPGIAIGDVSTLSDDLDGAMKGSSLTHITAVSGAHVAIVLGAVLALASALRVPRVPRVALGGVALACFVALVGPGPSVLRSALMGAVTLLALGLGRTRGALGALGASVLVLLVVDPWIAREYGFALSVVATAALIVLAPRWERGLERHMPRPLAAAIAVPAAAQAACGPIIVLFAGQVSVVGVAANIVAIPAIPLATTCGVLACLFGPLGGWWLEAPLRLAAVGSAWIAWVARWSTSLPGSVVAWPGGVVGAIGLIGATAGGVVGLIWVAKRRRRRWVAGAAAVCLAVAAVSPIGGNVRHAVGSLRGRGWAGDWQVAVCDVGQGTAVAIRAGPTSAVLVDTGPDDGGVGQCLDALGVERIPALILTHLHADHAGGLAEAIRGGRMPDTVLTPVACGQAGQEREVARVADKATVHALASSARNPSPVRGTAGIVTFEVFASALDTRCRAPATGRASSGTERVVNDASLAIHAAVGNVDTWVLGDLEDEGQRALARAISRGVAGPIASGPIASRAVAAEPMVSESEVAGPAAPRSADASSRTTTVAVVAHHGSAKQDDGLASLLAPDIAAFSVGADNGYGHPAASALAMYARVGAAIVRTDEDGHIAIRADGTVAGERTGVAREATAGSPAESLPTGGQ